MQEPNPPRITASKFVGIFTNVTPNEVPAGGAQDQFNCRSQIIGQLDVRGGVKPVTFGNATTSVATSIISQYQVPAPGGAIVLYETADGNVRVGRTPALP